MCYVILQQLTLQGLEVSWSFVDWGGLGLPAGVYQYLWCAMILPPAYVACY